MDISIHIGAHGTFGSTLMRSLRKNGETLAAQGIHLPPPAHYAGVLPELMRDIKRNPVPPEIKETTLKRLVPAGCSRTVLSLENAVCLPSFVFEHGELYYKAGFKLPWLRNLFAEHNVEFVLGIRNPATFIPETLSSSGRDETYADFMRGAVPTELRWSDLVARIHEACPDVALTVFAFEDTPIIWPDLMRATTGIDTTVEMDGELDILKTVMTRNGLRDLRTEMHEAPPETAQDRRDLFGRFLEQHYDADAVEQDVTLPGWTDEVVEELTDIYEEDLDRIAVMPDVTFTAP